MFIRIKKISGKEYAYLVENKWHKGRTKQRVKKYLGPVMHAKKPSTPFAEWKGVELQNYMNNTPVRKIIKSLISHAVSETDATAGVTVRRGGKEYVLSFGDGFLCRETIKFLLNFKPVDEERKGERLAEAFVKAGIVLEKEVFILLYRRIYNV